MKYIKFWILIILFHIFFVTPALIHAEELKSETTPTLQQRFDDLEQRQKVLEEKLAAKEKEEEEKAKVSVGADGFSLSSKDGNYQLRIRGLIQADGRFYLDKGENGPSNTFITRRVRPIFEGTVAKRFDFRIMPDFAQGRTVLFDAWIDSTVVPEFAVMIGKFKDPVGLERLESAADLHFVERGLPTQLVPNRDVGGMLHGSILGGVFNYQLAFLNGVADGQNQDFDFNDGKEFEGRIFTHPLKKTSIKPLQGFGVGVSGTWGTADGSITNTDLPSYVTTGQQTFFRYRNDGTDTGTTVASGERFRVSPQGYYYYKGFGFLGEYVLSEQGVALGADTAEIFNQAWQVATTYVIGADNSYGRIKPKNPLGWKNGGTGAFEFGFRYNELKIDPDAFPIFANPDQSAQKAKAWGVGFNWILNQNVKFALNFEQTRFDGGAANGGDRHTENVILNRYQIGF